jgi:hypothetical protein
MALKPQSIRKGMVILIENQPIEKQDLLKLSESWTEQQENFFKKMLKQGGEFKIQGKKFKTIPPNQILTSKGEKDAGVIQIPGLDSRF